MSNVVTKNSSIGISFGGVLVILFIGLKLTHNIDWSWWWVSSPLWIPVCIGLAILIVILAAMDLTNLLTLEDQLVGVDSAYFTQLINTLKDKQSKDPNFHVNLPYVTSIMDRIF